MDLHGDLHRDLHALSCPVRGCALPLDRRERALDCAAGHSFDVARSGYVNLLQPQDRRSLEAGDSKAAVEARARLEAVGVGAQIVARVAEIVGAFGLRERGIVLDVGCGTGRALATVARASAFDGIGLDLSVHAVELAAKRHRELFFAVANADRRLPLLDGSIDLVLSLAGPKNPAEFRRVLSRTGTCVLAIPGAEDLIELRAAVQGEPRLVERASGALEPFLGSFELVTREVLRERRRCERALLLDLLASTYRGARASEAPRVAALDGLELTMSVELLVLSARP